MEQLNFDNKQKLVQKEINHLLKRNISALGKITFVRSLLLSKFTNSFKTQFSIDTAIKKSGMILFGEIEWIKYFEKHCNEKGGFRMTNIEIFIKSLKHTWIEDL